MRRNKSADVAGLLKMWALNIVLTNTASREKKVDKNLSARHAGYKTEKPKPFIAGSCAANLQSMQRTKMRMKMKKGNKANTC